MKKIHSITGGVVKTADDEVWFHVFGITGSQPNVYLQAHNKNHQTSFNVSPDEADQLAVLFATMADQLRQAQAQAEGEGEGDEASAAPAPQSDTM